MPTLPTTNTVQEMTALQLNWEMKVKGTKIGKNLSKSIFSCRLYNCIPGNSNRANSKFVKQLIFKSY